MSRAAQQPVPALLVVAVRQLVPETSDWLTRLGDVVQAAADWPAGFVALQLRFEPPLHPADVEAVADRLQHVDAAGRLPVYWNLRAASPPPRSDWHVHLPENRLGTPPPASALAHGRWSASVHDVTSLRRARGATFVIHAPIFTPTWKQATPVGLDALKMLCSEAPMPVLALGGITPQRIGPCRTAGAAGVAVASGVLCAADVARAVADHAQALSG